MRSDWWKFNESMTSGTRPPVRYIRRGEEGVRASDLGPSENQATFLLGLFWGKLIFRRAYYWNKLCISKLGWADDKNSLEHYENSLNRLKQLTVHGLIFGKA